jgi:hypothetical protein
MPVTYSFTLVPLGLPKVDHGKASFPVYVVSYLSIDGDYSYDDLARWVEQNPVLAAAGSGIRVRVGKAPDMSAPITGRLSAKFGVGDVARFVQNLKSYLRVSGTSLASKAIQTAQKLPPDGRFDALGDDIELSNSPRFYLESVHARNHGAFVAASALTAAQSKRVPGSHGGVVDGRLLSVVNSVVAQEMVTDRLRRTDGMRVLERIAPSARSIGPEEQAEFLRKYERFRDRVSGYAANDKRMKAFNASPTISEEELEKLARAGDPNVLLSTAVKEPLMARLLGLVTEWEFTYDAGALPSPNCLIEFYGLTCADADCKVESRPTAFTVKAQVYPSPREKKRELASGLAWLNGRDGGDDYLAIQVDADEELTKAWHQQGSNTLRTIDRVRAPNAGIPEGVPDSTYTDETLKGVPKDAREIREDAKHTFDKAKSLAGSEYGVNEPSTYGIVFSASQLDFGAKPDTSPGAPYYLEDLLVGYRLDVSRMLDGSWTAFASLHSQRQTLSFVGGATFANDEPCECFIDREQLASGRPTSTEFARWTGVGNAQTYPFADPRDGRQKDSNDKPIDRTVPERISKVAVAVDRSLPRLWFPGQYRYRIRNVFLGGLSLHPTDADSLLKNQPALNRPHVQEFGFYRTKAMSPGIPLAEGKSGTGGEQVLYLTKPGETVYVCLFPEPVDLEHARYSGLIGTPRDDLRELDNVSLIDDPRTQLRSRLTSWHPYFLDSDVSRVRASGYSLTRNPIDSPRDAMIDGRECKVAPFWHFGSRVLQFGSESSWLQFRPVRLTFCGVQGGDGPVDPNGNSGASEMSVRLAPGDVVEIALMPEVGKGQLANTYFYRSAVRHSGRPLSDLPPIPMLPMVAERRVRVVHATPKPLQAPRLLIDPRFRMKSSVATMKEDVYRIPRPYDNTAHVPCAAKIHAATTGEVRLRAAWVDVKDEPLHQGAIEMPAAAECVARGVLFAERDRPSNGEVQYMFRPGRLTDKSFAELADRVNQVCLEDELHYLMPKAGLSPDEIAGANARSHNAISFPTGARRIVKVRAAAFGRYPDQFPALAAAQRLLESDASILDIANREVPMSPQIKRVLPLIADEDEQQSHRRGKTSMLRFYFAKGMFGHTGVGSRCAIGFIPPDAQFDPFTRQFGSQWGEDPLEHPKVAATRQWPKASDFRAPGPSDSLSQILYPEALGPERTDVLYDSAVVQAKDPETKQIRRIPLHLASYALRLDSTEQLYYLDVKTDERFFGWLRLALYVHQPHSEDGRSLSPLPTAAYAAVVYDEPVTHFNDAGWWTIRIGPIFDRSISYRAYHASRVAEGALTILGEVGVDSELAVGQARYYMIRLPRRSLICLHRLRKNEVVGAIVV